MIREQDLARLSDLAWGPMDAKQAAGWLGTTYDGFRGLAPKLPRHHVPGLGWRYYRGELDEWVRSGGNVTATVADILPRIPTPERKGKPRGGKKGEVKRLV